MYQLKITLNDFRNVAWGRDLASTGKSWAWSLISLQQTSFSSLNMLKYVIRCTYIIIWKKYILNKWGNPTSFWITVTKCFTKIGAYMSVRTVNKAQTKWCSSRSGVLFSLSSVQLAFGTTPHNKVFQSLILKQKPLCLQPCALYAELVQQGLLPSNYRLDSGFL